MATQKPSHDEKPTESKVEPKAAAAAADAALESPKVLDIPPSTGPTPLPPVNATLGNPPADPIETSKGPPRRDAATHASAIAEERSRLDQSNGLPRAAVPRSALPGAPPSVFSRVVHEGVSWPVYAESGRVPMVAVNHPPHMKGEAFGLEPHLAARVVKAKEAVVDPRAVEAIGDLDVIDAGPPGPRSPPPDLTDGPRVAPDGRDAQGNLVGGAPPRRAAKDDDEATIRGRTSGRHA